ncbi:hypothetical protein [Thetidibacter halocola]|uniref:Uncharacterized protein n=1 Tax=Thetidibacter halocola TaxID=2827239 RepID=A0A8J7WDT8_9RHOB|nr:hypothetical protein [Thetidibacter halocola]MBS0125780.1 hypothetical protein [Thetidibacter halocola]
MIVALLVPSLILIALAILLTRAIERMMPETVPGMVLTGIVASILMWLLSGAMFGWFYLLREAQVAPMLGTGRGMRHLAALGGKAALIWLPIVLITVATAPRRWKTNTW